MKRLLILTTVVALALSSFSCGDKIQVAKTVLAFVDLGVTTVDGAFDTYAAAKRTECLKAGPEGSEAYTKCYKATKELMEKWGLIEPKIEKSAENAATYIKAVESGKTGDYVKAVKETVCLFTEIYNIIPDKGWEKIKKKIKMYVDLAGVYTCAGKSVDIKPNPERDRKLLLLANSIFKDLLGKKLG